MRRGGPRIRVWRLPNDFGTAEEIDFVRSPKRKTPASGFVEGDAAAGGGVRDSNFWRVWA